MVEQTAHIRPVIGSSPIVAIKNMDKSKDLAQCAELINKCRSELARHIIGQEQMINGLLTAIIAGGHILIEGVPGLAKTLAVKSLAEITNLEFKRIQFTPDLLPADLTGSMIWNPAGGNFSIRRGPVFANIILADEINRAPAKIQSALLEAMEERQITIGETSHPLPDPFFVLATENPIEHEGTYPLPEAELDRFLLKLLVNYPSPEEELKIIESSPPLTAGGKNKRETLSLILDNEAIKLMRKTADSIHIDKKLAEYIVSIVTATRPPSAGTQGGKVSEGLYRNISFGASPRASIALQRCSKILALFSGKDYVSPEDIKIQAYPVLRHRLVLSYEAQAEGLDADTVISRILSHVPIP